MDGDEASIQESLDELGPAAAINVLASALNRDREEIEGNIPDAVGDYLDQLMDGRLTGRETRLTVKGLGILVGRIEEGHSRREEIAARVREARRRAIPG